MIIGCQRALILGIISCLLSWPALLTGAAFGTQAACCGMACCRASAGHCSAMMKDDNGDSHHHSASDSETSVGCACNQGPDVEAQTALPKIILDQASALPAPQVRKISFRRPIAVELAGHLRIPLKPPTA